MSRLSQSSLYAHLAKGRKLGHVEASPRHSQSRDAEGDGWRPSSSARVDLAAEAAVPRDERRDLRVVEHAQGRVDHVHGVELRHVRGPPRGDAARAEHERKRDHRAVRARLDRPPLVLHALEERIVLRTEEERLKRVVERDLDVRRGRGGVLVPRAKLPERKEAVDVGRPRVVRRHPAERVLERRGAVVVARARGDLSRGVGDRVAVAAKAHLAHAEERLAQRLLESVERGNGAHDRRQRVLRDELARHEGLDRRLARRVVDEGLRIARGDERLARVALRLVERHVECVGARRARVAHDDDVAIELAKVLLGERRGRRAETLEVTRGPERLARVAARSRPVLVLGLREERDLLLLLRQLHADERRRKAANVARVACEERGRHRLDKVDHETRDVRPVDVLVAHDEQTPVRELADHGVVVLDAHLDPEDAEQGHRLAVLKDVARAHPARVQKLAAERVESASAPDDAQSRRTRLAAESPSHTMMVDCAVPRRVAGSWSRRSGGAGVALVARMASDSSRWREPDRAVDKHLPNVR